MKQCTKCSHLRPDVESEPTVRCPKCGGEYLHIEVPLSKGRDVVLARVSPRPLVVPPVRPPPLPSSAVAVRPTGPFNFKTATPAALKTEYNRIAKEIGDDQFFTKRELAHVPSILAQGEQVLAFSSGLMDGTTWLIVLTDSRILFLDKGMVYGLKQSAIDLDKVNTISAKTGLLMGEIRIQDGASERKIEYVWKKTALPFTNKARDAINARKQKWGYEKTAVPGAQTDDVVSRLERLAVLMEKGVLSREEFAQQKAKLLAE